jgi:hypothetical protein
MGKRFRRLRKRSIDRAPPGGQLSPALSLRHRRRETALQRPSLGKFRARRIKAGLQSGEIAGSERRRLAHRWAIDRRSDQIGEALHHSVGSHPAPRPQLGGLRAAHAPRSGLDGASGRGVAKAWPEIGGRPPFSIAARSVPISTAPWSSLLSCRRSDILSIRSVSTRLSECRYRG